MRLPIVATLVLLSGCGAHTSASNPSWNGKLTAKIPEPVRTALEQAQEFELLSLNPKQPDPDKPAEVYRRKVIGRMRVAEARTRTKILAALDGGAQSDEASAAMCFDPRHAISVLHGDKKFYVVICFECNYAKIYTDDHLEPRGFLTTNSPESVFDEVMRAAGVQLAKKRSEE